MSATAEAHRQGHSPETIDVYDSVVEAVSLLRETWCEDDDRGWHYVIWEEGLVAAVMMKDSVDPEVCHTLYTDGRVEHHRCHYVCDGERYLRSEVAELATANRRSEP
jgi:hypothetical protein